MIQNQALLKIDKRIYIVFIALIAVTLVNAIFSTYTIQRSHTITSDIVYNTNPSLDALSKMNLLVTKSRMLITNWVYLPHGSQNKSELQNLNTNDYILLRGTLTGLMQHWTDSAQVKEMADIFYEYENLVRQENKITNLLYDFDDFSDAENRFQAEDILEREIITRSQKITTRLEKITANQTKTALLKQDAMLYRFNSLMVLILGFAVLIICSVLITTVILSKSIIVPVLAVRDIILRMGRGELPEMKLRVPDNAVGEMSKALGFMISGFRQTSRFVEEIGQGNFEYPYEPLSNIDVQGHALVTMRNRLKEASDEEARRMRNAEGLAQLNETMRANSENFDELLNHTIEIIVEHLKVQQAAIFLLNNDDLNDLHIQLGAYYALNNRILNSKRYELREGLVGQAVASNRAILVENQYDPFFTIDSGLGESASCNIMIVPLTTSGKVVGAIEIASTNPLLAEQKELLEKMAEPIAASLFSVRANLITSQLLEESRKQAEELASQEQELRKINNELTLQSNKLRISEDELKTQQEELKNMNIQLREKARLLEEQNLALEETRLSLSFKASQLEESNKFKSAFLANMSHELRTPLNSILILARLLADNKGEHLSQREIEHAQVIYKSGTDLLNLINDILDLSKIEAGKVELILEQFSLNHFSKEMYLLFREVAADRNIHFEYLNPSEEIWLNTDQVRLSQVVKNLLSNAFKFTPEGGTVSMSYDYAVNETVFSTKSLLQTQKVVCIQILDTGIGIPEEKQNLIFEAFQQADGSTSRKFGGTGLGLSITRELVSLMGGEIQLSSAEKSGCVFSVFLPAESNAFAGLPNETTQRISAQEIKEHSIHDDRGNLKKDDQCILIIEDDYVFAKMLMNQCHRYDSKAIIALEGEPGLQYAREYQPDCILLDMRLPTMDGWLVLKKLKQDPDCKHIPVHILTAVDKMGLGLEMGADSYVQKPVDQYALDKLFERILNKKKPAKYLYAGNNETELTSLRNSATKNDAEICVEDDISDLEGMIASEYKGVLVSNNVSADQLTEIEKTTRELNIPMLYINGSPDECLREASNLLNANSANQKIDNNSTNETPTEKTDILKDKKVLLADDDMRNIYSITHILEDMGMEVINAFDGADAIEKLIAAVEVDIVLMDIMMPNMNGIEAITEIRKNDKWANLPIIAVTAKAMTDDREICLNAGASDYLTKPIQTEQLVNMLKVWLHK